MKPFRNDYPVKVHRPCTNTNEIYCVLHVDRNIYNSIYNCRLKAGDFGWFYKVEIPTHFCRDKPIKYSVRYIPHSIIKAYIYTNV